MTVVNYEITPIEILKVIIINIAELSSQYAMS